MKKSNWYKPITPWVIIFCAVVLCFEVTLPVTHYWFITFKILDWLFLIYFSIEIIVRWMEHNPEKSFKSFIYTLKRVPFLIRGSKGKLNGNEKDILEHWFWMFFDSGIVLLCLLSETFSLIEHPELASLFRLFRIFRVLKIFEVSPTLQKIENKIISVMPTVFVFAMLVFLLIFVYAILGMYMFKFKEYTTIDFSNFYNTICDLFIMITNGWSDVRNELNLKSGIPLLTDFYIFSFVVFSSMITLNVFLAVMTGQIQEKIHQDLKRNEKLDEIENKHLHAELQEIKAKLQLLEKKIDKS